MSNKVIPTKANLIKTKAELKLSKKGYNLLDKKRTVLIKEMTELNKKVLELQETINSTFKNAYTILFDAIVTMGEASIKEVSDSMELETPYEIIQHSIMGVEIPEIKYNKKKIRAEYSFYETTAAFDTAVLDMNNIKILIYKLAELETGVYRLSREIKKTQRRANALEKIQIPKYTAIEKEIEGILEEKAREAFFRLKKFKKRKDALRAKLRKNSK